MVSSPTSRTMTLQGALQWMWACYAMSGVCVLDAVPALLASIYQTGVSLIGPFIECLRFCANASL